MTPYGSKYRRYTYPEGHDVDLEVFLDADAAHGRAVAAEHAQRRAARQRGPARRRLRDQHLGHGNYATLSLRSYGCVYLSPYT